MPIAFPLPGWVTRETTTLAKPLLPDELREIIAPILPKSTPSPKGGQPRLDDRQALTGIPFVLKTGIPWEDWPRERGCGCGRTGWRRLRAWQADGTRETSHKILLDRLRGADQHDSSRGIIDSSSVRAASGGEGTGPSPVDRAQPGSKHHIIVEAHGIPLAARVTGADVPDIKGFAPLFNTPPAVGGEVGHPRTKPGAMRGDRGSDSEPHRQGLRELGIEPLRAEKNTEDGSGLGVVRGVVERTLGWIPQNRRLRIRSERRPEIHQAFLTLACIKICASFLFNGYC